MAEKLGGGGISSSRIETLADGEIYSKLNANIKSTRYNMTTSDTLVAPPTISKLPVTVEKPTPYTFDLGLLLAQDPNPFPTTDASIPSSGNILEDQLAATARDGAQALLNQLLSTCPIASTPNGVLLSLPATETQLPREKVCQSFKSGFE